MAFEFVRRMFDLVQDRIHKLGVVAGGDYLGGRFLLLEVQLQYRVHQLVRRQAVQVELVRCKLG